MKKKMRISLAVAVTACVLLAAVAFAAANRLGLLDFIVGRYAEDISVLPEATSIIENAIAQSGGHTAHADFTVRQAVYDGQHVYIAVAVTPNAEKTLLLGVDSDPNCPASDMGARFSDRPGSVEEFAKTNGIETFFHTNVGVGQGASFDIEAVDFMHEADGTLVYMLSGATLADEAELPVELTCLAAAFHKTEDGYAVDETSAERATLSFTLHKASPVGSAQSVEAADFTDCGVRVESVKLEGTAMALYTEIIFSVTDPEIYALTDGGLWFEFLDESGEPIPDGATAGGSITPLNDEETEFVQRGSLSAVGIMPQSVTLRGYNCWEKNRYEAHAIAMR